MDGLSCPGKGSWVEMVFDYIVVSSALLVWGTGSTKPSGVAWTLTSEKLT